MRKKKNKKVLLNSILLGLFFRSGRIGDKVQANIAKLLQKKKQMEDTGGDYSNEEESKNSPNSKVLQFINFL